MLKVKIPQNHIGNSSALIFFSSKLYVGKNRKKSENLP